MKLFFGTVTEAMAYMIIDSIGIEKILFSLAFINGFLLFIILSKQVYRMFKNRNVNIHIKIMHLFALSGMFTSTSYCLIQISVMLTIIPYDFMDYSMQSSILQMIWITSKFSISLLLIARYVNVYSPSKSILKIMGNIKSTKYLIDNNQPTCLHQEFKSIISIIIYINCNWFHQKICFLNIFIMDNMEYL